MALMKPSDDPVSRQIEFLVALSRTRSIDAAARACGIERDEIRRLLADAETRYGRPIVRLTEAYDGLTDMGEVVLRCAPSVLGTSAATEASTNISTWEAVLSPLLSRRSVSPKRLGRPGPSQEQLDLMLQAALTAPDHGSLHPWRVIEFRDAQREQLADLFEAEKQRRDPLSSRTDLRRAREHATRPPTLLAFIVSPRQRSAVPSREQWLAAGAALCNLLNAAHQLGFGAIMLSGERCYDHTMTGALGIRQDEVLAGFVSLGRIVEVPPDRKQRLPGTVWTCWMPPEKATGDAQEFGQDGPSNEVGGGL